MKVTWAELEIPGLIQSSGAVHTDDRGQLTKVLSGSDPLLGEFEARELYWTISHSGVVRGMHFQLPPTATRKLIYVVSGSIRDFVVDLRVGSPAFGQLVEIPLDSAAGGLLVPAGCAHAYESMQDNTIVCYAQDVPYSDSDTYGGLLYSSVGITPRAQNPIINSRDLELTALQDFVSPFVFSG
jgi:dTDP-4-dehydrorhamnose 3,5-epimerase